MTISITTRLVLFSVLVMLTACHDDDVPPIENESETITRVTLTFINTEDETDVVSVQWFDEDGEGSGSPVIDPLNLTEGVTYLMNIQLENTLATPVDNITEEVQEESDEHKFFFSFTDGLFSDPTGDGNTDQYDDPLNYQDEDVNGVPIGLETKWTAGMEGTTGDLEVVLKHQPDEKSATSTYNDGETDTDVLFPVTIQ